MTHTDTHSLPPPPDDGEHDTETRGYDMPRGYSHQAIGTLVLQYTPPPPDPIITVKDPRRNVGRFAPPPKHHYNGGRRR